MLKGSNGKKIYFGGNIITMNDINPHVDAVGIDSDKIVAVGKFKDVEEKLKNEYNLIDLKGKTLLPGFIDSHIHAIGSIFLLLYPSLKNIKNINDLRDIIKKEASLRRPDELLIAFGLDEEKLENPVIPTKWDLDEACPDTPVFIFRHDIHIGIANSKLLKLIDINNDTIAPEGGEIKKNDKGEITGV